MSKMTARVLVVLSCLLGQVAVGVIMSAFLTTAAQADRRDP
jgi:hypothetical protein